MELKEAKSQFIAAWGSFGSNWGINRTMAQIHALLMISAAPVCTEEVMETLSISRGNTNMNMRELINWGLVHRVVIQGERKEFFSAEKDMFKVSRIIVRERKKRELEPMLKFLDSISDVKGPNDDPEIKTYRETINDIRKLGERTNQALDKMASAEESWFWGTMLKLIS